MLVNASEFRVARQSLRRLNENLVNDANNYVHLANILSMWNLQKKTVY